MTGSQHVKLLSFAVEAATDEVGVLLDGTGKLSATPPSNPTKLNVRAAAVDIDSRVIDVTIEDLVITASTRPAFAGGERRTASGGQQPRRHGERAQQVAGGVGQRHRDQAGAQLGRRSERLGRSRVAPCQCADRPGGGLEVCSGYFYDSLPERYHSILAASRSPGRPATFSFWKMRSRTAGRNAITLGSVLILDNQGNDTGLNGRHHHHPRPMRHDGHARDSGNPRRPGRREHRCRRKASQHSDQPQSSPQLRPVRHRTGRLLQSCAGTGNHHDREPNDCGEHHLALAAVAAFAGEAGHVASLATAPSACRMYRTL